MAVLEQFISEKFVDAEFADRLRRLRGGDLERLEALIVELAPSANTLREYMQLADAIVQRDSTTLANVLVEMQSQIQENLGRKDKQRLLREALERRRFPQRTQILEELFESQRELRRDLNLQIDYPRDLEGDQLQVSFSFRNAEDLNALSERLKVAVEHPALKRILAILRGELSGTV